jgi:hypothetical protein
MSSLGRVRETAIGNRVPESSTHFRITTKNRAGEQSQDQLDLPGADGGKDDYQEELEQ